MTNPLPRNLTGADVREGSYTCPFCGAMQTKVQDSRPSKKFIRRRRYCNSCAHKFSTIEIPVELAVVFNFEEDSMKVFEALNETVMRFNLLNRAIKRGARLARKNAMKIEQP